MLAWRVAWLPPFIMAPLSCQQCYDREAAYLTIIMLGLLLYWKTGRRTGCPSTMITGCPIQSQFHLRTGLTASRVHPPLHSNDESQDSTRLTGKQASSFTPTSSVRLNALNCSQPLSAPRHLIWYLLAWRSSLWQESAGNAGDGVFVFLQVASSPSLVFMVLKANSS